MTAASPSRLPSGVPAAAFLRADDRLELERDRVELYVVHVAERDDHHEGGRIVYWLRSDAWPSGSERVLELAANAYRRAQADELRAALRRADRVGPFRLSLGVARGSGRPTWLLVSPEQADAQLQLGGDADT